MLPRQTLVLGYGPHLNEAGEFQMTTMDTSGRGSSWSVGSVIGTSFSTLFGHFLPFVGTALVASLPSLLFAITMGESWPLAGKIVDMIVGQIVTVTLVYGTVQALRGRKVSVVECLFEGMSRLGAALGVGIVVGLGIGVGMLLLIVPGLILMTIWAVAVPVSVMEHLGISGSLSRSSILTDGSRWRVFGAMLAAILISLVIVFAFTFALVAVFGDADSILLSLLIWAVGAVFQAYNSCVVATLYFYLRRDKEGLDIHQIGSVFD